ncbi:hypothetical protein NC653_016778 [Populus alba x Populus x berolinensis]|uniref:Uncharacterized protein n=1 Tax=Populus alba x Populus x berolinensis TaxID=444605 RepID=A0AAD6QNM5_9ROSI|nr:hypothetical protein NC653_016778 [Populus alba x Populus x berolinensis]
MQYPVASQKSFPCGVLDHVFKPRRLHQLSNSTVMTRMICNSLIEKIEVPPNF